MPFYRFDVADVDLVPRIADNRDLLGFQAGHGQAVGELLDGETGIDVFREPTQRNFHRIRSLAHAKGHGMPCPYWPSRRLHRLGGMGELAEEAKIVAGKRAHVVDAGAHHRQTLDAEPEGKAAVDVRVVADRAQDIGMDHAGAPISSQPLPLQTRQPAPPQMAQSTAKSTPGSTNGKKSQRNRMRRSAPKSWRAISARVPSGRPS